MSDRRVVLARADRPRQGGSQALERFFRDQQMRDLRKRSQPPTGSSAKHLGGVSRKWWGLARGLARRHPLGMAADIARAAMALSKMPAYSGFTGFNMAKSCPNPNPYQGCTSVRPNTFPGNCIANQAWTCAGAPGTKLFPNYAIMQDHQQVFHDRFWTLAYFTQAVPGDGSDLKLSGSPDFQVAAQPARPPGSNEHPTARQRGLADGGDGRQSWPRWPQLYPEALPINRPAPVPLPMPRRALPHRRPNPWAPDQAQPQWGPGTPSRPLPWEPVVPGPTAAPRPQPAPKPSAPPDAGPTFGADPKPGPMDKTDRSTSHKRPDRKRERERKVTVHNTATRMALKITNLTTESCDAIDSFWKALPDAVKTQERLRNFNEYRARKRRDPQADPASSAFTCAKKAAALWRNWDKVDMQKALENLAENEVEDRAFGKAGETIKKGARDTSVRGDKGIHWQAGPWDKAPKPGGDYGGLGKKPWDGMFDGVFR